jgi:hypothetical protein
MADPVTAIVVGGAVAGSVASVASQAAKQAQDFVAALSGHPGESIGTILGTITRRRLENVETVANKAYLTLLNIGVKATAVPLPVFASLLEGSSLQEEPSMREIWANLLANAADPRNMNPVRVTFPAILRELSVHDVRFLDAIEKDLTAGTATRSFIARGSLDINEMEQLFDKANESLADSDSESDGFEYSLAVLMRHNLISQFVSSRMVDRYDAVKNPNPKPEVALEEAYSLSSLARRFIAACNKPTRTAPEMA